MLWYIVVATLWSNTPVQVYDGPYASEFVCNQHTEAVKAEYPIGTKIYCTDKQ